MAGIEIVGIEQNSIAEELSIIPGSKLIAINGNIITDRMDYLFHLSENEIEVEIEEDGKIVLLEIEKEIEEDLGLQFKDPLMDEANHCNNKCIFCFIDQMPKGMRETLYFKDDDSRLSFMQGNFVTLTNMSHKDLQRIVTLGIHPINVSVHSTDPLIRKNMTKNPKSEKIMEQLKFLASHGTHMNAQIVLLPEVNDGESFERTIADLESLYPSMSSIAVVPVGLTKFRKNLPELRLFTKEECESLIGRVEKLQEYYKKKNGTRFVFLADEFYIKAEKSFPENTEYEGFLHYENGVGMVRRFLSELTLTRGVLKKHTLIATGVAFGNILKELCKEIDNITVLPVVNQFFGEDITVTGLLTYSDIVREVKKHSADRLLLCDVIFNHDGITLDNRTQEDFKAALGISVDVIKADGKSFTEYLKE